jgi:hypothetical protein
MCSIPSIDPNRCFFDVAFCGSMLAATTLAHEMPLHTVILNTATGARAPILLSNSVSNSSPTPRSSSTLVHTDRVRQSVGVIATVTLYPHHLLVVTRTKYNTQSLLLYELPALSASDGPASGPGTGKELSPTMITNDHVLHGSSSSFRTQTPPSHERTHHTHITLELNGRPRGNQLPPKLLRREFSSSPSPTISPLKVYVGHASPDSLDIIDSGCVELGTTGRRAVWIQEIVADNEVSLMKLSARPETQTNSLDIDVLLHPHDLPFPLNHCQSLAFEEATGRLCFGLINGDVYVIDF